MLCGTTVLDGFLADRTATQYDRLLASSCRPSVCLFVCLSVCDAVHSDTQGWCTGLKVAPACSEQACSYLSLQTLFRRMYRLATKRIAKNEVRNAIYVYGLGLTRVHRSRKRTARYQE